jgi:hypothetical protein
MHIGTEQVCSRSWRACITKLKCARGVRSVNGAQRKSRLKRADCSRALRKGTAHLVGYVTGYRLAEGKGFVNRSTRRVAVSGTDFSRFVP